MRPHIARSQNIALRKSAQRKGRAIWGRPTRAPGVLVGSKLTGRVDEAQSWLDKAEKAPGATAGNLVLPRVLVTARSGQMAELARMLDDKWRELEGTLTGEASAAPEKKPEQSSPLGTPLRGLNDGVHFTLPAREASRV